MFLRECFRKVMGRALPFKRRVSFSLLVTALIVFTVVAIVAVMSLPMIENDKADKNSNASSTVALGSIIFDVSIFESTIFESTIFEGFIKTNDDILLAKLEVLNRDLSIINDKKISFHYERSLAGFWKRISKLQPLKLRFLAQKSHSDIVQAELAKFDENYDSARTFSESFLLKEFNEYVRIATTYYDPNEGYFNDLNDTKMSRSMSLLKNRVHEWLIYLPASRLLLDYKKQMQSITERHELAIKKGHQTQRDRIAQSMLVAKPIETELSQQKMLQQSVRNVAQHFVDKHQRILSSIIDHTITMVKIRTSPLQITAWSEGRRYDNQKCNGFQKGCYTNQDQGINANTPQKATFSTVGQDRKGGCHAIILLVEKRSVEGGLGEVLVKNVINQYPLDCANISP